MSHPAEVRWWTVRLSALGRADIRRFAGVGKRPAVQQLERTLPRPFTAATAEAELRYTQNSQKTENRLHFFKTSLADFTSGEMSTLAAALKTWWDTNWKVYYPASVSLREIVVRSLSEAPPAPISYTTGLPLAGTNTGVDNLPNNVTIAVKLATAFAGRSHRGRVYLPGVLRQSLSTTVPDAIGTSTITSFVSKFAGLIGADTLVTGMAWAVLSEIGSGEFRPEGIVNAVVSVSVDQYLDSQRRRLPGRGQ